MSELSRKRLVEAYEKGYRITNDGVAINPKGKALSPRFAGDCYYAIGMRDGNIYYSVPYHRLMAYQKFGDLLFAAYCVRHLNGNHLDNSYDNIEIGTFSDNMMDIPKETRIAMARNATQIKYKNVQEIRDFYDECHSMSKTMQRFGITSKGTLHFIIHHRVIIDKDAV